MDAPLEERYRFVSDESSADSDEEWSMDSQKKTKSKVHQSADNGMVVPLPGGPVCPFWSFFLGNIYYKQYLNNWSK